MAGISWVRTGSSNNPGIVRYTHFLPPMRRTTSLRIPWNMSFLGMKSKAEKTEAAILARLSGQEGVTILLPFGGGNGRYDMVIDDNGTFYRVQCKTGHLEQGGAVVAFNAGSSTYHYYNKKDKGEWRNYRGAVEYFGVYCPQINRAFLVPVDIVGSTEGKLRLVETKNNQSKNVHWAEDYEI